MIIGGANSLSNKLGHYLYTISGWVDPFLTWYDDFQKRIEADQDVTVDLQIGSELLKATAERALGADAKRLKSAAADLGPGIVNEQLAALASELSRSNAGDLPQRTASHCRSG